MKASVVYFPSVVVVTIFFVRSYFRHLVTPIDTLQLTCKEVRQGTYGHV